MSNNRIRDERHLRHVAKCGCCCDVSESANGSRMADMRSCVHETVVPHHIMYAEPSAMGLKSGDNWTVPLCHKHHMELHNYQGSGGERLWWALRGIDPLTIARSLWQETLDYRAHAPIVRAVDLPNRGKKTRSTKLLGSKTRDG